MRQVSAVLAIIRGTQRPDQRRVLLEGQDVAGLVSEQLGGAVITGVVRLHGTVHRTDSRFAASFASSSTGSLRRRDFHSRLVARARPARGRLAAGSPTVRRLLLVRICICGKPQEAPDRVTRTRSRLPPTRAPVQGRARSRPEISQDAECSSHTRSSVHGKATLVSTAASPARRTGTDTRSRSRGRITRRGC